MLKSSTSLPVFSQIVGRWWSTKIKPCLCVNIIRCSTVHLVRVRAEFVQCLILGLEKSSWQWRRHITDLHREPFFNINNRLSFWRQICFNKSVSCATERWEVRNVTLESRLSVPSAYSNCFWIDTCGIRCLCESFWLHHSSLKSRSTLCLKNPETHKSSFQSAQLVQQNSSSNDWFCRDQRVLTSTLPQHWEERKVRHWEKWLLWQCTCTM